MAERVRLFVFMLLMVACAPAAVTPSPAPIATALPSLEPAATVPPGAQSLVDLAVADLAQRLSIDPGQIAFVSFAPTVWPDAALGCPQPGVQYAQVQVEGYAIQLQAGDRVYAYHGGESRGPFLCEQ